MGPAVKMALASGLLAYGMGDFEDRWAGPGFKSSEKPGSQAEASPQQGPPLAAGAQTIRKFLQMKRDYASHQLASVIPLKLERLVKLGE